MFTTYTFKDDQRFVGIKDSAGNMIRVAGRYSPANTAMVVEKCNQILAILPEATDRDILIFVERHVLHLN
jgi:hypothetical protein